MCVRMAVSLGESTRLPVLEQLEKDGQWVLVDRSCQQAEPGNPSQVRAFRFQMHLGCFGLL